MPSTRMRGTRSIAVGVPSVEYSSSSAASCSGVTDPITRGRVFTTCSWNAAPSSDVSATASPLYVRVSRQVDQLDHRPVLGPPTRAATLTERRRSGRFHVHADRASETGGDARDRHRRQADQERAHARRVHFHEGSPNSVGVKNRQNRRALVRVSGPLHPAQIRRAVEPPAATGVWRFLVENRDRHFRQSARRYHQRYRSASGFLSSAGIGPSAARSASSVITSNVVSSTSSDR